MGWLDALERRAREAVGNVPAAHPPARQPPKPQSIPVIKTVPVQTAAPFRGSPGAITVGYFVVMHDESGKPTGMRMPAGEYPRQVAYLMTRESWKAKAPDFNRQLNYRPLGLA